MKKYLMTGIAALTFSGMITSCSHDMDQYTGGDVTENIQKDYETKFVSRFGEPASNQDWGFGSSSVAGTRGMTRTIQPSFDFPEDADESKFLEDVPAGVNSYSAECVANNQTDGYGAGTSYVDPTWTGQVNIWGVWDGSKSSGGTLYIKGENDFTNRKFYVAQNTEIYLVKDAVLKLSSTNASDLQGGCNFYLADGAKIITDAELVLNNGLHIYNHGTIEANKLHANSNSVLYNVGIVKVATKISVENNLSVIVNDGEITAADLNTAGSGKFENNGTVTISGTTFVNSNSNTWVNNGQYHTGNFLYNAASDEVINNCRLTVDEDFNINLGDNPGTGNFKMDAGSGVVTKYFNGGGNWNKEYSTGQNKGEGGPFYIYMGANSVFKVTETATMNATKADYGIYGPADGGYAVFQAKNIVMGKENQGFEVTYGNNLYVSAESHFANGNDGQADHPYIDFKGNAKIYASGFEEGLPSISISRTPCNPGFNESADVIESVRVIAEDLTVNENKSFKEGSDFDFNDVVFDVNWNKTQGKVSVKVLAAGGELTLYIGGTADGVEGVRTVNDRFKEANPEKKDIITEKTMINTAAGYHNEYNTFEFDLSDNEWEGDNINAIAKSIYVRVMKSNALTTLKAEKGKAAAKICVGTDYVWCDERQDIDAKYPSNDPEKGKFSKYVNGQGNWDNWYHNDVNND